MIDAEVTTSAFSKGIESSLHSFFLYGVGMTDSRTAEANNIPARTPNHPPVMILLMGELVQSPSTSPDQSITPGRAATIKSRTGLIDGMDLPLENRKTSEPMKRPA